MAYIFTIIAVVLAAVFALLAKIWAGFVYFVLASLLVLSIFWAVYLILKYFKEFKKDLEDRFVLYKAQVVNSNELTGQQFEQSEEIYRKNFNKSMFKEKFFKWFEIAFAIAMAVTFLIAMIFI